METFHDKVSIIVPIYNKEKYIKKCIETIINQTYKNLEIILVDDGSNDRSFEICKEYADNDKRIKLMKKQNGGVSSARNIGIEKATGAWITFVDSDDWVEENMINEVLRIANIEKADIVQWNHFYSFDNKEVKRKEIYPEYRVVENLDNILLDIISPKYGEIQYKESVGGVRAVWGRIYKKSLVKDIKFNEQINIFEDGIFALNVIKKAKKMVIVNKYLYHYRYTYESISRSYNESLLYQIDVIVDEVSKFIKDNKKNYEFDRCFEIMQIELLSVLMTRYYFNSNNKIKFKEKRKQLEKKVNNQFKEIIDNVDNKYLNSYQKISVFLLRKKQYFIIQVMFMIKNIIGLKKLDK